MNENVLIAKNVNKIYSKNTSNAVKALDNLNLEVKRKKFLVF